MTRPARLEKQNINLFFSEIEVNACIMSARQKHSVAFEGVDKVRRPFHRAWQERRNSHGYPPRECCFSGRRRYCTGQSPHSPHAGEELRNYAFPGSSISRRSKLRSRGSARRKDGWSLDLGLGSLGGLAWPRGRRTQSKFNLWFLRSFNFSKGLMDRWPSLCRRRAAPRRLVAFVMTARSLAKS